ncbi:hypothetical protein V490_08777 [Pseudogymnoascus sp. VKM F-3557]|nr:hypothetical protein V490_08777 [Pseudogymnoascus sp. VKM F-3557]
MEYKLQEWIYQAVIEEAKLLRPNLSGLSDSEQDSLRGSTRSHEGDMRVHLSGTRIIQIIDFNGQRKAPFTNISVSDISYQIRASLSEAARKQFEKKYDRRLPRRIVGAIFEIGGCCLHFNLEIKGASQVTLSINSLVLKGGEGSSNLGYPAPINEIKDVSDLISRMKNTTTPQAGSARSRYEPTRQAESPSGDEIGSPDGPLATQAPSDIYDEHSRVTKKPAPLSRTVKTVNLPGNQLLGLIGKNKKSNPPSSNLKGGVPGTHRSISLSDNKRAAAVEDSVGDRNDSKFIRLSANGRDAVRMPVNEHNSAGSRPIIHPKQGAPGKTPGVDSNSANKRGDDIKASLVDSVRNTPALSKKEPSKPTRNDAANSRLLDRPTFSSPQENPWGKLRRIPLKHVMIPKNQLVKLSTGASWVASVADIESEHISLPCGASNSAVPLNVEHVENTANQVHTTLGPAVEARQSRTGKHGLDDGSAKGVEMSSPRNNSQESQHVANIGDNIPEDTACQNNPPLALDIIATEEDDVVSWAPTSRASSVGPSPENEKVPPVTSASPLPHSNQHSPQAAKQVTLLGSSLGSPCAKLNMSSNIHLPSTLPSLSDLIDVKPDNGSGLKGANESLANSVVHSSIPYSEDDMEQRLPYAIGDVIQSSDDIHMSRIPASALTMSPSDSQQSPVLQIERTPHSHSRKVQPSLPEKTSFLRSPWEPKSIQGPHSPTDSIILGTFNWDAGNDGDTARSLLMDHQLQEGHGKNQRTNDGTMEPSAGIVAPRSERPSTAVANHPSTLTDAGQERAELRGENRNRMLHSPIQKIDPRRTRFAVMLNWYRMKLATRPMLTQSVTTAVLFATGDIMAQQAVERKGIEKHEFVRTGRMALYGGAIFGPAATTWFKFLQTKVVLPNKKLEICARVGVDQLLFAPTNLFVFLSTMSILEGVSPREKLAKTYTGALQSNWMVWPFVQVVNFSFVPLDYRVLFVNGLSIFWNCYLSYISK